MGKLLILIRQKRNLEQDFIIIKAHTGPIEKKVKYHSNIFMNIIAKTVIMGLMIGCKQLKERETFWQHRLKTFYPNGINEKKEYLY